MREHPTTRPRKRWDDAQLGASRERDIAWFRAEFFAWNARKGFALTQHVPGTDIRIGYAHRDDARVGRVAYLAAVREAYRIARHHPLPLP